MMRALLLALLVLLPACASAGTERDPEITDPADQADTSLDIRAAWFEARPEGLRFSIKTTDGSMPKKYPDRAYFVVFEIDGREIAATTGFDGDGVQRGYFGPLDGPKTAFRRGGMEKAENDVLVDLSARLGRPSVFSATIPWGADPALRPGATLEELGAGAAKYDRARNQWIPAKDLDRASAAKTYVATPPTTTSIFSTGGESRPPWLGPVVVLGTTVAFAAAGGLASRALERRR